jgi:hypothetical protein
MIVVFLANLAINFVTIAKVTLVAAQQAKVKASTMPVNQRTIKSERDFLPLIQTH